MPVMARICSWKVVASGKIYSDKKSHVTTCVIFRLVMCVILRCGGFCDLLYAVRAI